MIIHYRVSSKSLVWLFSTVCFQNSPTRWVGGDSPKRGTHWLETEAGREGSCVDQVLLVDHQMSFLVLVFGSGSQRWSSDVLFGFWTRLDELFSTPSIFLSWDLQRCRSGQGRHGRAIPPLPSSVPTLHSGRIVLLEPKFQYRICQIKTSSLPNPPTIQPSPSNVLKKPNLIFRRQQKDKAAFAKENLRVRVPGC